MSGLDVRHDDWTEETGTRRFLLRAANRKRCACLLVFLDSEEMLWRESRAIYPREAYKADRRHLVSAMPPSVPASHGLMMALGALSGIDSGLTQILGDIHDNIAVNRKDGVDAVDESPLDRTVRIWRELDRRGGAVHPTARMRDAFGEDGRHVDVLKDVPFSRLPFDVPWTRWWLAARDAPSGSDSRQWCKRLHGAACPPEIGFVSATHWASDVASAYLAPGMVGTYRRQAGVMYPFLAPLLVRERALLDLIDAGRPFEDLLVRICSGWLSPDRAAGLTKSKLRRLRGIRRKLNHRDILELLDFAARAPVEGVTYLSDQRWSGMDRGPKGHQISTLARNFSLDPGCLLRDARDMAYGEMSEKCAGIEDMAQRLSDDVVEALIDENPTSLLRARRVAGHILFGGRTLASMIALCDRWHADIPTFEASMPKGVDLVSWPALFEPYGTVVDGREVEIRCLLTPSELRAEGGKVSDAHGPGLWTCVGGYGRTCHHGLSWIASIRERDGVGWRRVSTVEFKRGHGGLNPAFEIVQHQGHRNTEPPEFAQTAVARLALDIHSGERPVSKAALERRDGVAYYDGLDRTDVGVLASILTAWEPYLPRDALTGGVDGFRDAVSAANAAVLADVEATGERRRA